MLVTTYAAFDRYHHEDAAPWERVALLRARPVFVASWPGGAGGSGAATSRRCWRRSPTSARSTSSSCAASCAACAGASRRSAPAPGDGALHLRFSPGGLTDLEFLVALRAAAPGPRPIPSCAPPSPFVALSRLVEQGELPEGEALLDDYRFLQRASLRLRLLRDRPDDQLEPSDEARLARSLGLSREALLEELATRMARIRRAAAGVAPL